jgi:hypothetical protein
VIRGITTVALITLSNPEPHASSTVFTFWMHCSIRAEKIALVLVGSRTLGSPDASGHSPASQFPDWKKAMSAQHHPKSTILGHDRADPEAAVGRVGRKARKRPAGVREICRLWSIR